MKVLLNIARTSFLCRRQLCQYYSLDIRVNKVKALTR